MEMDTNLRSIFCSWEAGKIEQCEKLLASYW